MSYLFDSDWIIDWLAGKPGAVELFALLASEGIAISLISCGEIYEGIYSGRNPHVSELGFLELLGDISVLLPSLAIMRRFAGIRGDLRRAGQLIGDMDMLIAATALEYELSLVTRNLAHFSRIADLQIYSPN